MSIPNKNAAQSAVPSTAEMLQSMDDEEAECSSAAELRFEVLTMLPSRPNIPLPTRASPEWQPLLQYCFEQLFG